MIFGTDGKDVVLLIRRGEKRERPVWVVLFSRWSCLFPDLLPSLHPDMVKPILFEQSSEAPRAVIVMHRDIDAWKTAFCEPPQCDGQQPFAETSVMVEIDFESTDF